MRPITLDDSETKKRFFGKYRGLVIDNLDPLQIGRIQAQVPDVLGEAPSSWALPCIPAAGARPAALSSRQSARRYGSIWTGGRWGLVADVPVAALTPAPIPPGQNIVLQTTGQNALVLSDAPPSPAGGGVALSAAGGAMIVMNDTGVTISNRKGATITLIGPTVSINSGAVTVTGTSVTIDGAPLTPL
jgi:Type VI secretion system/phage-baseplate injector OB domain